MRNHNPGEIKQGRKVSPVFHAINNYVGQAKYEASHLKDGVVPSGKYVYPAIGLTATGVGSLLSAPVATVSGIAGGWTGGKAADFGTKLATGKKWAEWVSDKTGLVPEAAEMTNPGMWAGGGLPFAFRGSRTLLSVGDQIVKDAAKDVVHYGPIAVMRNPKGWYRPYVDQVKNGWQGWKDMRLVQRNGAIRTDVNQPYFEFFTKRNGKFNGSDDIYDGTFTYKDVDFYTYPEYQEGIGNGILARWKLDDTPLYAVTQKSEMPNTYLFHIGGDSSKGSIDRAAQLTLGRMKVAVSKYSYIGKQQPLQQDRLA